MLALEFLPECTNLGKGVETRNLLNYPEVYIEASTRFTVEPILNDRSLVVLTPSEALHPLASSQGLFCRGVYGCRSFSMLLPSRSADIRFTLVFKGGDVQNKDGVLQHAFRVSKKQIPGAGNLPDTELEFDSAMTLQKLALEKLGMLTHTALPLAVRKILTLRTNGQSISLRDFLNSDDYLEVTQEVADVYGLKRGVLLGDLILDQNGVVPAAYIYVIEGLDIRTCEMVRILFSQDPPSKATIAEDELYNHYGILRPLISSCLQKEDKFILLTAVYKTLGNEYGFTLEDITEVITDRPDQSTAYLDQLNSMRDLLRGKAIALKVLTRFIKRVVEVAALAHSEGYTLAMERYVGSSLSSRNVTYNGIVLDLDTFGSLKDAQYGSLYCDLKEMLATILVMRRLVSRDIVSWLFDQMSEIYLQQLRDFEAGKQRVELGKETLHKIKKDMDAKKYS
ncbi:hypothetical protein HYS91_05135 [Candidatus Daviesbacteria bacterium]|nr:hypothetical protein [Candidatus Daviesbacteria bacterium]